MKGYLAGPIAHDANCNDWRKVIIESCSGYEWHNPLESKGKDGIVNHNDYRVELNELRKKADDGDLGALDRIKEIMADIIYDDIINVDKCDFLIVNMVSGARPFGTICEMFLCKCIAGKPIYMITNMSFSEMNNWEIAMVDKVFKSLDDLIEYLNIPTGENEV